MPRCSATNAGGQPCRSFALHGSSFCYMHDPTLHVSRSAARRRGGRNGRLPPAAVDLTNVDLKTTTGLRQFIEDVIHATCALEPSAVRSRTLGYLARIQGKTIELNELDLRLQALERVLTKREAPDPSE